MSDAVKWALLAAGIVVIIGLIAALPFVEFINAGEFGAAVDTIVTYAGSAFGTIRRFLNLFLGTFGRSVLSGVLIYTFTKKFILVAIKIVSWVYHFVFK